MALFNCSTQENKNANAAGPLGYLGFTTPAQIPFRTHIGNPLKNQPKLNLRKLKNFAPNYNLKSETGAASLWILRTKY